MMTKLISLLSISDSLSIAEAQNAGAASPFGGRQTLESLERRGIIRRFSVAHSSHHVRWALEVSTPVLECVKNLGSALAAYHGLRPIGQPWSDASHNWRQDRIPLEADHLLGRPIYTRTLLFAFLLPDIDGTTLIRVVPMRNITLTPTKLVRDGLLSEQRVGTILRYRVALSSQCAMEHKALLNALVDSMPDFRAEALVADRIRRVGLGRKAYAKHLNNLRDED